MKAAALIIQKYWQGYAQRKRYQRMRVGYMRLQALIRSRVLSHRFRHLRGHIVGLQVSQASISYSVSKCRKVAFL
jgi:myosin-7